MCDFYVFLWAASARLAWYEKVCPACSQLACARIASPEGQDYLAGMGAAANYAWVNRTSMTFLARQAFATVRGLSDCSSSRYRCAVHPHSSMTLSTQVFDSSPDDLDMHLVYDVSHNIAKVRASWLP